MRILQGIIGADCPKIGKRPLGKEFSDSLPEGKTAVAIGKFDGVHCGHRLILKELSDYAKANGLIPTVLTFDPDPESFFAGTQLPRLTTREEKRVLLSELGVELLIEFPMRADTVTIEPERFVKDFLVKRLNAACIVAGTDLSFGFRGRGDAELLTSLSDGLGYEVRLIRKLENGGKETSSTEIRQELSAGRMETVNELLGWEYGVSGIVLHGKHLGTQIGFPTVNLVQPPEKLLPPDGVYFSHVRVLSEYQTETVYYAVTNIGTNPTVSDRGIRTVESFLYDFDGDLYNRRILVNLLHFQRPEHHFSDIAALRRQLACDVQDGRRYFHHCV